MFNTVLIYTEKILNIHLSDSAGEKCMYEIVGQPIKLLFLRDVFKNVNE